MSSRRKIVSILSLVGGLLLFSCKEDVSPIVTPNAKVYFQLNLELAKNKALRLPGGQLVVNSSDVAMEFFGYGGVLLVRSLIKEEFYAYDASCPYENKATVSIEVVEGELQAKCPRCHSAFEVIYGAGNPIKGKAKNPLRPYRCYYDRARRLLTVTN